MDKCIKTIIKNEKIDGIVVGSTVHLMKCFSPIYNHATKNNIPVTVPKFPLTYANIDKFNFPSSGQCFLVFGGGKLIDFAKICAQRDEVSLIVLLSSVSNDGFSSSFSSIKPNEKSYNQSYKSKSPQAVYACLPLLNKYMPHKFWVSGLGELLSKLNVWEDLKADRKIKQFDETPFYQVEHFIQKYTKRNESSLIAIIKQLYTFSLLMKNDSSWCSRSEHEFEKLYADSKLSHGQLVLMGSLVAMKVRCICKMPHLYEHMLSYCRQLEINWELQQEFNSLIESNSHQRMKRLSSVRPERFGLWNIVDSKNIDWKPIIREISKEL